MITPGIPDEELGALIVEAYDAHDEAVKAGKGGQEAVCTVNAWVLRRLCLELTAYRTPHPFWPNSKPKAVK